MDPTDPLYGTVTSPPPATPPSPTSSSLMVLHDSRLNMKPAQKIVQELDDSIEDKENTDVNIGEVDDSLSLPLSPVFKSNRRNLTDSPLVSPGYPASTPKLFSMICCLHLPPWKPGGGNEQTHFEFSLLKLYLPHYTSCTPVRNCPAW